MKPLRPTLALLWNLGLLYLLCLVCRGVYVAEFWDLYAAGWADLSPAGLLFGAFRFDTASISYTNAVFGLLVLLPLAPTVRHSRGWQCGCRCLFVAVNSLALWTNLFDTVYSRYTGRRTTASFFAEFSSEGNLGGIAAVELLRHWYLVLLGLGMAAALYFLYRPFHCPTATTETRSGRKGYILGGAGAVILFLTLCVGGMRSGFSYHRPITLSDANRYVNRANEANIVLNTPFALIRTIGKTPFADPGYYAPAQLDTIFSPLHQPRSLPGGMVRKNVVIIILESFGEEYWGCFNRGRGYTPFLDSLAGQSLHFRRCYANGHKSIDAMPSILTSLPMFVEPYVLTPYANNETASLASCLGEEGWTTAFFHGADNASMGFQAFARSAGFQRYYGMDEYCRDPRGGGRSDYDGNWGIFDEEFLQFFARVMDTLPQPFLTGLFTVTSHHPFNIPTRYEERFQGGSQPIHRTIRYTDYALRRFFAAAARTDWYRNTLFVITADHTNLSSSPTYQTDIGWFRVPVLLFDPSSDTLCGTHPAIMQQIDIMPTLLGLLGYPRPYLAFGTDVLHTPATQSWAVNYNNGLYQLVLRDTLYQFDGTRLAGLYDIAADSLLNHNLVGIRAASSEPQGLRLLKAIVQSYMQRMASNRLTTGR